MTSKAEKVAGIIQEEVSEIAQFSLKDPKIGLITITDVAMTDDLPIAKVYIPFLGQKPRGEAGMKTLDCGRSYLRNELTKRITVRKVPELIFRLDDSLERGSKIKRVISEINK